ncbi:complex I intermediate-associated protein 30-domain-containing protein [Tuber borchii]|uniref:Complex I intermediate-associated protein 30-domain-containing protein n=1 Tax=Tuber borchii TaxID=42251 RepID=A0A2T6ZEG3_TUBBO|nr:complex I intermediate-associated protein 30-domain-containing protein [Tuber borchii]
MRPALRLLRGGFLQRSIDEMKRNTFSVFKGEGITGDFADMEIHSFRHPDSLKSIKVFSDADTGGFSKVHMDLTPCPLGHLSEGQFYGRFYGNISIELPVERPKIQRSGYAAWRTQERGRTLFGRQNWDCDPYTYLALRVKSDGSKYFVNIQTDSIVETDIHQHRLFAKRVGEWETIHIPFSEFVRTNFGQVIEPQNEMMRQKVKTVGIGLIDRIPGPFELCIDRIWATNTPEPEHVTNIHREHTESEKVSK